MPALSNTNGTILVTGANGFIATWIVSALLKKGYSVRATVRSEAKGTHLLRTLESYGNKLKLCIVPDMGEDGAFDEAVKETVGIVHTASAVHLNAVEPKDIIEPAVNGVVGILKSALKNGSSVERIVFTSSCAAVAVHSDVPFTTTEATWNHAATIECEEKGRNASGLAKYSASKIFAEKAAWEFVAKHKAEIKWDLSTINPPWVFGPLLHDVTTFDI